MSAAHPILVIRLGAMGDIIHALPAVATLKRSFPRRKVVWLVAGRWVPLLEGNPYIDELAVFERKGLGSLRDSWRRLRAIRPGLAIDFQGLVQSALAGWIAGPEALMGFDRSIAREPLASHFYTHRIPVAGPHRVERNMQLVRAAGADEVCWDCWLPEGKAEGSLPARDFVLASPFAGWNSKQWPLELYEALAERLLAEGLELVVNVPAERARELVPFPGLRVHSSSLAGLIHATRRAVAVIGVDSGPLHLAAALGKPGVALFGPTDPAQTGPFHSRMAVLRSPEVETSYRRESGIHASMREISVEDVAAALRSSLIRCSSHNVELWRD
ncbi:MAG: glycosyltransferase family 9 protein [Acidobacteriaceae bacterium]|nr:glycosyltransferase family 9 protein [Acidobacteriaceae bacterium]